ncbi:cytochrome P450 [Pseudomassariella vexata]|uniref:Cytochrome P450 n=1 Tax=Pseudomassariella vexata TaxID=1141098 RepID=A0A1Y2DVT3_9PEZI|nr:cytochrome P450 [Pseudomassariella vexata]ORY63299.1 cytochrome P450 [Pseudomassariella vexata]
MASNQQHLLQQIISAQRHLIVALSSVTCLEVAGVLASGVALYAFSVVFYRLFLHPYAKYPGPIIAKISGLPVLYHSRKGDFHHYVYILHNRYGEKVRYSPNKLSINRVEALNDIYGFNKNVSKPEEFYSAFRVNKHARNVFNTADKEEHRRKRRIMSKAFSAKALPSYAPFISSKVDEISVKLNGGSFPDSVGHWRQFNMADEVNYLMLDIMGGLCFGEPFGFIAGKGIEMMANVHARAVRIYMTGQEPLLKRLSLDRVFFPHLFKAAHALGEYTRYYTEKRIKSRDNLETDKEAVEQRGYEDILAHLINNKDDETGSVYSQNELLGEATLLMMAGSDTSTTAINTALFYITNHPRVRRKLEAELLKTFPELEDIHPNAAENCKYLRACLDEAMRLCPSVPSSIPRVIGEGGIQVVDEKLPAGLWVSVPHFTLFRNAKYFDRPHDYIPERWIAEEEPDSGGYTAEEVKISQTAFQPFSVGPRHCIARNLALREMTFALARIYYLFDVEPWDVFTSLEKGPELRFKAKAVRTEPIKVNP